jgi:hypothetical protein
VVQLPWIQEGESTRASLLSVWSKVRPARWRPPGQISPWCHLSPGGVFGQVGLAFTGAVVGGRCFCSAESPWIRPHGFFAVGTSSPGAAQEQVHRGCPGVWDGEDLRGSRAVSGLWAGCGRHETLNSAVQAS